MVKKIVLFLIIFLISLTSYAQNKYDIDVLVSTEFYNADFNELNEVLESRELIGTYLGLTISKKDLNSYLTLGYKFISNISDKVNLKGGSFYTSINYDILKKEKHMLYPKMSMMLANYTFETNENLPSIAIEESFKSNSSFSLGFGIGYEYLFKINFIKKSYHFALGINVEKSFEINNLEWTLGDSNVDFLDFNLESGVKTIIVIRMML